MVAAKITNAKVIVSCPGRNFVTLKIETEQGVYGVGDATLNGRELAVASYLQDHLVPCLIGRDASQIEDIWQYFYKGAYWRRGPVTMAAIAAVDVALWDIKGKMLDTPVYNLLGGRCRHGVMVYGHANGETIDDTVAEVGKYIEKGYLAIRAQTGVPGIKGTYGVSGDKMFYEPAGKGLPEENEWSTEKYLNHVPKLFEKIRQVYGDDPHLLHDCHHRLTPIEAARLGKALEPYHLFWLEDTIPAELQDGFRIIREHTTTPLAVGEVFNTVWDCEQLLREQLIDYIRTSVVHAGGISHVKKIASMAEVYHVRTGCHGPTDISPISMAAQVHLNLSINNAGVMEYMLHTPETMQVFPSNYHFDAGYVNVADKPGIGVDIDEAEAAKYPYDPAYLPINRKLDGSMFSW
jgi:mannonate dehydratase